MNTKKFSAGAGHTLRCGLNMDTSACPQWYSPSDVQWKFWDLAIGLGWKVVRKWCRVKVFHKLRHSMGVFFPKMFVWKPTFERTFVCMYLQLFSPAADSFEPGRLKQLINVYSESSQHWCRRSCFIFEVLNPSCLLPKMGKRFLFCVFVVFLRHSSFLLFIVFICFYISSV